MIKKLFERGYQLVDSQMIKHVAKIISAHKIIIED